MLADDLEAELSALEDAAPITEELDDQQAEPVEGGEPQKDQAEEGADEWKPPSRETYENVQKALRAEREEKRRIAQQSRIHEQNIASIERRVQEWQQNMVARSLSAPPPDPFDYPEAARQYQQQQQQQLQQFYQAEQSRQAQAAQQAAEAREFDHIKATVEEYEAEFKAENPDYDDAADYVLGVQQKLLEGMGYPPAEASRQVAMWSLNVAKQAVASGRDPATTTYQLAAQMGYQRKGTAPADAAAKLAAMKAGQASSQTLSGGGAVKPSGASLEQIANLEGAAFDSAMDKYLHDAIRGR